MIVPDLNKTEEKNLIELRLRNTLATAELTIKRLRKKEQSEDIEKSIEIARRAADAAVEALEEWKPDPEDPIVDVGYIPSRKLTSIRNGMYLANRNFNLDDCTREQLDAFDDLDREIVRWGVKGHRGLDVDYKSRQERAGAINVQVATWETVDMYERLGMLPALRDAVMQYNRLDDSKKKRSPSSPGTIPDSSIATSVDVNPSYDE